MHCKHRGMPARAHRRAGRAGERDPAGWSVALGRLSSEVGGGESHARHDAFAA
ncbi:MAG: hypothetical protein AAF267_01970 [Deinococcota bacterium]